MSLDPRVDDYLDRLPVTAFLVARDHVDVFVYDGTSSPTTGPAAGVGSRTDRATPERSMTRSVQRGGRARRWPMTGSVPR
jgi:hypothetical protein